VKILVADDSVTMRNVVQMTFAAENAEVLTAGNGEQALRAIAESRPEVILIDSVLPGTDGYEICRAIRSNSAVASTAVILLTSQFNKYDTERGRECGVDDHVIKPFDTQALIDRVSQVMSRPRSSPAPKAVNGGAAERVSIERAATVADYGERSPSRPQQRTVAFGSAPPFATDESTAASRSLDLATRGAAPLATERPVLELAEDIGPNDAPTVINTKRENVLGSPPMAGGVERRPIEKAPSPAKEVSARSDESPKNVTGAVVDKAASLFNSRLSDLNLSDTQLQALLALSKDVVEKVAWEVVPDLAETIIREEIRRLTRP